MRVASSPSVGLYALGRCEDKEADEADEVDRILEVEQALGVTIGDDSRRLERAGRTLLRRLKSQGIVLTRGSRGMAVFVPGKRTVHVPVFGTDEVADVTGAGDTVIATVSLALAAGSSLDEAARLANYAGGLVVMKRGTAAVSADELRHVIQSDFSD